MAVAALSLSACAGTDGRTGDRYHLLNDGYEIPVLVQGSATSDTVILFVNGGPGLSAIDVAELDLMGYAESIETHYLVAYYDPRGSASDQGRFDEESISLPGAVDDLAAVVELVSQRYPEHRLIVMGHSWGGYLSALYLIGHPATPADAWIVVNGSLSLIESELWVYRRELLISVAAERIDSGVDVNFWQDALAYAADHPVFDETEEYRAFYDYIGFPGEGVIPVEPGLTASQALRGLFLGSYDLYTAYLSPITAGQILSDASEGTSVVEQLGAVTLPTAFIWGRYDDLVPVQAVYAWVPQLGTLPQRVQVSVIDAGGHTPQIQDPVAFGAAVRAFASSSLF